MRGGRTNRRHHPLGQRSRLEPGSHHRQPRQPHRQPHQVPRRGHAHPTPRPQPRLGRCMPQTPGLTHRMHPANPRRDRRDQPIPREHQILHLSSADRRRLRHRRARQRHSGLPHPPHQHPRGPTTAPPIRPVTHIPLATGTGRAAFTTFGPRTGTTPAPITQAPVIQALVKRAQVVRVLVVRAQVTRGPVVRVAQRVDVLRGGTIARPARGARHHLRPPPRAKHTPRARARARARVRVRVRVRSAEPGEIRHPDHPHEFERLYECFTLQSHSQPRFPPTIKCTR